MGATAETIHGCAITLVEGARIWGQVLGSESIWMRFESGYRVAELFPLLLAGLTMFLCSRCRQDPDLGRWLPCEPGEGVKSADAAERWDGVL